MFTWCTAAGVTGWLVMISFWTVFVGLAIWAITRLIPTAPSAARRQPSPISEREAEVASGQVPAEESVRALHRVGSDGPG